MTPSLAIPTSGSRTLCIYYSPLLHIFIAVFGDAEGGRVEIFEAALIGITACARGRATKGTSALPARGVRLALFLGPLAPLAVTLLPLFLFF